MRHDVLIATSRFFADRCDPFFQAVLQPFKQRLLSFCVHDFLPSQNLQSPVLDFQLSFREQPDRFGVGIALGLEDPGGEGVGGVPFEHRDGALDDDRAAPASFEPVTEFDRGDDAMTVTRGTRGSFVLVVL